MTTMGLTAVLLAAVGCTSGKTASSATGTEHPPSSPAAPVLAVLGGRPQRCRHPGRPAGRLADL